jgi:hypothetical protein
MATENELATCDASHGKVSDGKWFHPARWFRRCGSTDASGAARATRDAWSLRWRQTAQAAFERDLEEAQAEELAGIATTGEEARRNDAAQERQPRGEGVHGENSQDAPSQVNGRPFPWW